MSAIGGVITHSGSDPQPALSGLVSVLRGRSLDGAAGVWCDGAVGLVQGRSFARPDGLARPWRDGAVTVVADARLDDTAALAEALGLPAEAAAHPQVLIAAAWRRWGLDAPGRLEGEFAFAVWDAERSTLFCARDRFGIKPFYYSNEGPFTFASSQTALLGAGCSRSIDEGRIADFLVGLPFDQQSVVYRSVRRLPPGAHLLLRQGSLRVTSYFTLEPPPVQPRADAAEAFGAVFEKAVAKRLSAPTAVMLSGGLDSSSIAAVAARLSAQRAEPAPIALSMVFDGQPEVDERRYVEAVLAGRGLRRRWLPSQKVALTDELDVRLHEQGAPFQAPTHHFSRRLYDAARQEGARVVLDGHGGDETVSFGYGRLNELAAEGRWLTLWRETLGVARTFGASPQSMFYKYLRARGPGRWLGHIEGRLARRRQVDAKAWRRLVAPDLAARTRLADRYRAYQAQLPATCPTEAQLHHRILVQANHSASFEVLDQAAAAAGVEARYPFWDRELIMLCLSLESHEKLNGGYARRVLRQSMDGVLPDSVRLRRDKVDFRPQVARSLAARPQAVEEILAARHSSLGAYVHLPTARQAWERLRADPASVVGEDVLAVWRTTVLGAWLQNLEDPPFGDDFAAAEPPPALVTETHL